MGFFDLFRKLWNSAPEDDASRPHAILQPEKISAPSKPPVRIDQVSGYFLRLLQRNELVEVTFTDPSFVKILKSELKTAKLDGETTRQLFRLGNKPLSEQPKDQRPQPLDLIISAVTLLNSSGKGKGLVLLAGQLTHEGKLSFELDPGVNPWIPSERLSTPNGIDHPVMVGNLSRFGAFTVGDYFPRLAQLVNPLKELTLAEEMFTCVSESDLNSFKTRVESDNPGYAVDVDHYYVLPATRIVASRAIQDLYSHLTSEDKSVLYTRMFRGWEHSRIRAVELSSPSIFLDSALRSCGNMSDGFPLTRSQRTALHATIQSDDGEVTAVSGPPGTGKTTLLQAVVANLITRHALEGIAPPVIVGTSTNNQAVTNIIESFASVTKRDFGPLDHRWLPTDGSDDAPLQGLAVFCPSQARLKSARRKYLVETTAKAHTYTTYSDPAYIATATDYYLTRARRFFPAAATVTETRAQLHAELTQVDRIRVALLSAMAESPHNDVNRMLQLNAARLKKFPFFKNDQRIDEIASCSTLAELDELLDVTVRYVEFWLAVHYFEAEWLELGERKGFIHEEDRWKNDRLVMNQYWEQAPLITPCFVMTCYQVPRYFRLFTPGDSPNDYDFRRIDLLIVDEAGQVDSPVGLANFSLAKRALVVGDEKQLSPVWSLDEETDRAEANGFGISDEAWRTQLRPRGLTGSHPSSLMRVASAASKYAYGNPGKEHNGLFLSEHFRCHPQIIGYCNELLYDGLLEPKRSPEDSKLAGISDPFIFQEVPGSADSRSGSSRKNETEAVSISRWILDNFNRYFEIYNEQEEDPNKKVPADKIIAVVTPFSAQARLIKKVLKREALVRNDDGDLPDQIWKKITVGTAHVLQGAERPIVLFSPTYGENSPRSSFIDSNLELINVAVSRAKDMFMVFGAINRWDTGAAFEVMSKYATRQSELPDVQEPSLVPEVEEDSVDVEPPTELQAPDQPVPPISVSTLIKRWREEGVLTATDSSLTAKDLNKRLHVAGILAGNPGAWVPTAVGKSVGVVEDPGVDKYGRHYVAIKYTEGAQELLKNLYLRGEL